MKINFNNREHLIKLIYVINKNFKKLIQIQN